MRTNLESRKFLKSMLNPIQIDIKDVPIPKQGNFTSQNNLQLKFDEVEDFKTTMNNVVKSRPTTMHIISRSTQQKKKVKSEEHQERLKMKTLWRQLMRWQEFDNYIFLRNSKNIKEIKGSEQIQQQFFSYNTLRVNDLFEPMTFTQGVELIKQNQPMKKSSRIQIGSIQPFQRFNPIKQAYLEAESPTTPKRNKLKNIDHKTLFMIKEIEEIYNYINEKLQICEIEQISPYSEKVLKILLKLGILNFYVLGSYIHCMILELYGKENISYLNWKRYLRICNLQGTRTHEYKLVAYRHLSKIMLLMQNYDKALVYMVNLQAQLVFQKKMLELAWIKDDQNFELIAYDMISLACYYKQDIGKAIFFHDKFSSGESEQKDTPLRNVGEEKYKLMAAKSQQNGLDLNSMSEDDFDLSVLMHKSYINKLETQQKRKQLYEQLTPQRGPIQYKQGHSFGKIKRLDENVINFESAMKKMNDFKARAETQLGPIYQKNQDNELNKQECINCSSVRFLQQKNDKKLLKVQFLFNQKSTNRVAQNFLLQCETNDKVGKSQLNFKPKESVMYMKKMIKAFIYDLKYYGANKSLFRSGIEL